MSWSRFWRDSAPAGAWFLFVGIGSIIAAILAGQDWRQNLGASVMISVAGALLVLISYRTKMHDDGDYPTFAVHFMRASMFGLPAAIVVMLLMWAEGL